MRLRSLLIAECVEVFCLGIIRVNHVFNGLHGTVPDVLIGHGSHERVPVRTPENETGG